MKAVVVESQPWGWSHAVEPRFAPLVARLEDYAAANPHAYRRRVLGGALLGYGFLALVIGGLLMGIIGLVALMVSSQHVNGAEIKLIAFLAIPAFLVLRALWVTLSPPTGIAITPGEAPALFAALARVRAASRGPALHAVLVTDDFNAAIVQHPRFGILGGYRNYLLIGLPLMQALDASAFEAVVAHEFGHLANADGKLSTFVYRVRATWARLSETLDGGTGAILKRFFNWYGPWFNAYSFVLARQNEYAADRVSAAVTSPEIAARALSAVMVEAQRFDAEHWQAVLAQSDHHDRPPAMPFSSARQFFAATDTDRRGLLQRALASDAGISDTHPSLRQRLAALGQPPLPPEPCVQSAAEALLPDGGGGIASQYDESWWNYNEEGWRRDRDAADERRRRLESLDEAAVAGPLSGADKYEHAWLTERLRGADAAVPLYTEMLTVPGEPGDEHHAAIALARLKLDRGDASGIDDCEVLYAEKLAPGMAGAVTGLALHWLTAHDDQRLTIWQARQDTLISHANALDAELNRLDEGARLAASGLPLETLAAIAQIGADDGRMRALWLCSRQLENAPPDLQYVLVFEASGGATADTLGDFMDAALSLLQPFGPAIAIQASHERRWLKKRVEAVESARIYTAKTSRLRFRPF